MKVRKIIITTSSIALLGAGALLTLNQPAKVNETTPKNIEVSVEKKINTEEPKIEKVEKVEEDTLPVPVEVSQPDEPTEKPVEKPVEVVKSSQYYAEKYLDLSDRNQMCFDEILKTFPARFTEDVREQNIKAIRAFTVPCATGITYNPSTGKTKHVGTIYLYGYNGEFFDTELAKKAAAK